MKNSLKFLMGLFFAIALIGQANADARSDRQWHNRHRNDQRDYVSDKMLKDNAQVLPFIPGDIKGQDGTSITCNEQGNNVDDGYTTSRCYPYHSKQTGTAWKVRYTNPNVTATQVFKIQHGKLKLWASFDEDRKNIYASSDAQRYASTHSNDDTGIARNRDSEPSSNPAQEASKINPADIVKKGLGTILPNIFK